MEIPNVTEAYRYLVQRSIEVLEKQKTGNNKNELDAAIDLATNLMRKELPLQVKNPLTIRNTKVQGMCPRCSNIVNYEDDRCRDCGQVVDWK